MHNGQDRDRFELIVVGGGVFGLSVALEAGRRGRRTLVVERRQVPNPIAASYGPSRKIRSTYTDPHYAALAREAMTAWRQVESEVGAELYVADGNLAFTALDDQPHLDELEAVSRQVNASIRLLDQADLQREFPQFKRAKRALFEIDAGFLRATACVEALAELARRKGVEILAGHEVEAVEPASAGLAVRVAQRTLLGDRVVVAGGGWTPRLLPELGSGLQQSQMGLMYVADVPAEFRRPAFRPFGCPDEGFYGFAAEDGVGLKVAQHTISDPTTNPDFDRSTTPPGFVPAVERFLLEDLGIDVTRYPTRVESCMYNLSPSFDFLLDFHPRIDGLFVATAGSGHGFKFGSILGTVVMDRLDGVSSPRWSEQFSYKAFAEAGRAARLL